MNPTAKTAIASIVIYAFLLFYSCRKEADQFTLQNIALHQLETEDETVLKKGQGISIFDATALNDSASFTSPPTNRLYEWQALPTNGCISLSGNHQHGKALVRFHCAGRYQVFAHVYDSANRRLVATTDTLEVSVSQDSLYEAKALTDDDVITFYATLGKSYNHPYTPGDPPSEIFIQLFGRTDRNFEYYNAQIAVASTHTGNNHSFAFADSVRLMSYPFVSGLGQFRPATTFIELRGMKVGVAETLNITWLGNTYTGTVTLLPYNNQLKLEWDNSGPIKMP